MKKRVVSCLGSGFLLCYFALPVKAESILERIQRTGVLRVAIREDAAPFGYLDSSRNLQGYCLDFFYLLEQKLVKNLDRQTLSTKLYKSTANNRFSLVANNIVDLECGPNTIRDDVPEDTIFSTTFFISGTRFLIARSNRDRFKLDGDLENVKLGVIRNTTTEEFVTEEYPLADLYKFSGATARSRGIQAVSQGKIDAIISEGILLRAEAQRQGLSASQYPLIPSTPLTCDRYGMILNRDSEWQNFVNSVINSSQLADLTQAWFGSLSNGERAIASNCD